jgi:P4 family phage/plasmid primase-like protien
MEAVLALSKASTAVAVREVLKLGVAAEFDVLEQAELIKDIAERTTFGQRDLRKMFRALQDDAHLTAPDSPTLLADAVWEKTFGGQLIAAPDGRWWHHTGTHWAMVASSAVRNALSRTFRQDPGAFGGEKTRSTVDAAYSILRDRCGAAEDPMAITLDPPKVINFLNGELWLTGPEPDFRQHSPASRLVHVLPIAYDELAKCPKFHAALLDIFGDAKMVRHFMEVLGYAIQPVRNRPKIVVLYGAGANGKSSLLKVMMAAVGHELVYSGSVAKLSRDNFGRAALAGRLLFVDDDLSAKATMDDGFLKAMCEAKPHTVRRAYGRDEFTSKTLALPVLATNNVPRIDDASHGLYRRLMVIPFARRFEAHEIKLDLFDQIISEELPGIVNEALAGLKRLNDRGDFDEPADCVAAKDMFFALANPLRGFIADCMEPAPGEKVLLKGVYEALLAWCAHNGVARPFPRNCMKSKLEGMGLIVNKSNGLAYVREMRFLAKSPAG